MPPKKVEKTTTPTTTTRATRRARAGTNQTGNARSSTAEAAIAAVAVAIAANATPPQTPQPTGPTPPRTPAPRSVRVPTAPHHYYGEMFNYTAFTPGTVISTAMHIPDPDTGSYNPADIARTVTPIGPVYSKLRKAIVVKNHWLHCVVVPIYTNEGAGLANKPRDQKAEWVAVRDADVWDDTRNAPTDNENAPLFATRAHEFRTLTTGFHTIRPSSYAHFTAPVTHRYDVHCKIEGHLDHESLARLLNYYNAPGLDISAY